MNHKISYSDVLEAAHRAIINSRHTIDHATARKIWLDLALTKFYELSEKQRSALQVSKDNLNGLVGDFERLQALRTVTPLMDEKLRSGEDGDEESSLNRMVCGSLMTTAEFDEDLVEFMVFTAKAAKITPTQVDEILVSRLINYSR